MASKLIGSWELQSDENINEYLKLIGNFTRHLNLNILLIFFYNGIHFFNKKRNGFGEKKSCYHHEAYH